MVRSVTSGCHSSLRRVELLGEINKALRGIDDFGVSIADDLELIARRADVAYRAGLQFVRQFGIIRLIMTSGRCCEQVCSIAIRFDSVFSLSTLDVLRLKTGLCL